MSNKRNNPQWYRRLSARKREEYAVSTPNIDVNEYGELLFELENSKGRFEVRVSEDEKTFIVLGNNRLSVDSYDWYTAFVSMYALAGIRLQRNITEQQLSALIQETSVEQVDHPEEFGSLLYRGYRIGTPGSKAVADLVDIRKDDGVYSVFAIGSTSAKRDIDVTLTYFGNPAIVFQSTSELQALRWMAGVLHLPSLDANLQKKWHAQAREAIANDEG